MLPQWPPAALPTEPHVLLKTLQLFPACNSNTRLIFRRKTTKVTKPQILFLHFLLFALICSDFHYRTQKFLLAGRKSYFCLLPQGFRITPLARLPHHNLFVYTTPLYASRMSEPSFPVENSRLITKCNFKRPAKSYTAMQTVRHRCNIYAGTALLPWRYDTEMDNSNSLHASA